jgi:hypothetical protein
VRGAVIDSEGLGPRRTATMENRDDRAAYYRRRAEEAMRAAEAAKNYSIKQEYEDIARCWLELAERHEPRSG